MRDEPASKPFYARCADCGHVWIVAYYPLELAKFSKIALGHSDCPKCGGPGMVAKQDNGVLLEGASPNREKGG
jgi:ribosomal protein S27AE